jgi:hypothetical protein
MSFRGLRRKYPLHFLLFNLILDDLPHEDVKAYRLRTRRKRLAAHSS